HLASSGFYRLAMERIEKVLAVPRAPGWARKLTETRDALVLECRRRADAWLASTREAALAKDMVAARLHLDHLKSELPENILNYVNAKIEAINQELRAAWGVTDLSGDPKDVARYQKSRPEMDEALAVLDVDKARRVVERLSGVNEDPWTISTLWLDRCRVARVAALESHIRSYLAARIGLDAHLPLRSGGMAEGKAVRIDETGLTLKLAEGGERKVLVGEFESDVLAKICSEGEEPVRFGLAVVRICRNERQEGLVILREMPKNPDAAKLLVSLHELELLPKLAPPVEAGRNERH
ncbi:MAG TPA: hypothetical protein VFF73_30420, partial [Planctomycetota bacterium]|nr:hypothetical protein [Planctomycetota bacterium]